MTKIFIVLVHLILGVSIIFGSYQTLSMDYSLAYNPNEKYYAAADMDRCLSQGLPAEKCNTGKTLRDQSGNQIVTPEAENARKSMSFWILEYGSLSLIGLLSIIGSVVFIFYRRRWASILSLVITCISVLITLIIGILGFPFSIIYLGIGIGLLIFIIIELRYVKKEWNNLL